MLGEENGVELCRKLRTQQDVPIIFVSALAADQQRVAGYAVGADDYIGKPFNLDLLLARVRAVLRRVQRSSSLVYRRNIYTYHFKGSKTSEAFNPQGVQVALSQLEIRLLKVFLGKSFHCTDLEMKLFQQWMLQMMGNRFQIILGGL